MAYLYSLESLYLKLICRMSHMFQVNLNLFIKRKAYLTVPRLHRSGHWVVVGRITKLLGELLEAFPVIEMLSHQLYFAFEMLNGAG